MKILVFNCGSSSIKYQLYDMPDRKVLARGSVQRIGEDKSEARQEVEDKTISITDQVPEHDTGLTIIEKMITDPQKGALESLKEVDACGHRVVHGGEDCTGSMLIDAEVEKTIEKYAGLAPLHNPPNLCGIRAAQKMMPHIPQVACFDTAFHQSIPMKAYLYGLPYDMYEKEMIRRYGFHGTSHRYVARRAAVMIGKDKTAADFITCHLGNGASITAVKGGKSVDTSMGLTPLEGLVMGTRSGDLDPAIIFHLINKGHKAAELDKLFNKKAGLLGISGISNDIRTLEEKASAGEKRAQLALDIFAYRIKKYIGAYLAVLNSCDGIILTGGIGENAFEMRQRIFSDMDYLGITIDTDKNKNNNGVEGEIQDTKSNIRILIIPTDEEGAIARDTYAIATDKK
ncbi:MAG TPA: acetate kinase [Spirochaetota bacterium]|nr:acetate kinase [Spirochaetota bacterium]